MPVIVVVGCQWGDEGKGRIVDLLAEKAQIVARYSAGNNAGHTIINELGEFALHLVPAGIFYPAKAPSVPRVAALARPSSTRSVAPASVSPIWLSRSLCWRRCASLCRTRTNSWRSC